MIVYLEYSYVGECKRVYCNFNIVDNSDRYIEYMKQNGYYYYEIRIDGVYKYWIDMDFDFGVNLSKYDMEVKEYISMNLRRIKLERLV